MTPGEDGAERKPFLSRMAELVNNPAHPDYLVHYYLSPCIAEAGAAQQGRLIDIGCGNKPYRPFFPQVSDYVGCDVVQSSEKIVDVIAPAHDIPLPDATFDVALCTQAIEHVEDPAAVVREAFRLLRPGGTFLISGPMYWPLHEEPYDFHRFTRHGLAALLAGAGFTGLTIKENGGKWSVVGLALLHALPHRTVLRQWRLVKAINHIFLWLDRRNYDPINTANYFASAVKPKA